jgi:hypothetical protein
LPPLTGIGKIEPRRTGCRAARSRKESEADAAARDRQSRVL